MFVLYMFFTLLVNAGFRNCRNPFSKTPTSYIGQTLPPGECQRQPCFPFRMPSSPSLAIHHARAIPPELQCVASPERGSARRPSRPSLRKRRRHLLTVTGSMPRPAATSLLCFPDAQPSTIRARNAKACAVLQRRASVSNATPVRLRQLNHCQSQLAHQPSPRRE